MSRIFDTGPKQYYRLARKHRMGLRRAVSLALPDMWIQWCSWWRFQGPAGRNRRAVAAYREAQMMNDPKVVERAARAWWVHEADSDVAWSDVTEPVRNGYRARAREALAAALDEVEAV